MLDKIMMTAAKVLMIVEVAAVGFLVWSWCDAKRRNRDGNS